MCAFVYGSNIRDLVNVGIDEVAVGVGFVAKGGQDLCTIGVTGTVEDIDEREGASGIAGGAGVAFPGIACLELIGEFVAEAGVKLADKDVGVIIDLVLAGFEGKAIGIVL